MVAILPFIKERQPIPSSGRATLGHSSIKNNWRKPVPKLLSEPEVADYRDRGYHFPLDALSAGEVADFRRKLEDYEASSGGPIKAEIRHRSHVLFTWIDQMIRHPKILDAVEEYRG